MLSSIANIVYELPHELSNDLRLRFLGNKETLWKFKFGWRHSLVPSLLSRCLTLEIAVKKHAKLHIKLFFASPVLLDFYILFQIFCQDWRLIWVSVNTLTYCFGFCKTEVPDSVSRDLWCHPNCHISCCNHWNSEKKSSLIHLHFLFTMKVKDVF